MLEDFTANIEQEGEVGEKAFESPLEPKTETPAAAPTEPKPEDKPSQEGENTPVASKPLTSRQQREESRWQKAQQELAELRKFKDEAAQKFLQFEKPNPTQIPEWFPKTGNQQVDEQKYKEYLSYESGVKAQIKQELLEDQTKEAQAKKAEEERWTNWVNDGLDALEDKYGNIDRNRIQKVALEYLPSDEKGNIDFEKAYKLDQDLQRAQKVTEVAKVEAKKQIGALSTTSKQTSESAKPKFENQHSLRNRTFDQLIRETN